MRSIGDCSGLAVLLTGDADAAEPWCWTPLPRCTACGAPAAEDDALPHLRRLLVAGQGRPAITISGTAAGGPRRGRGCLLHRHSAGGTAARRLGRDPGSAQAARQREAIVLTSCLDLSPDLAAAAMRVSLATLRRRLAEARSAPRTVLPSNL